MVYERNGVRISSFPVIHILNGAVGYRLDYAGRSVVFSGDTRPCHPLVDACDGADLLIHETFPSAPVFAKKAGVPLNLAELIVNGVHTSPTMAGKVFARAGARMSAMWHLAVDHETVGPVFAEMRTQHDGPVTIAQDLTVFDVTADAVVARQRPRPHGVAGRRPTNVSGPPMSAPPTRRDGGPTRSSRTDQPPDHAWRPDPFPFPALVSCAHRRPETGSTGVQSRYAAIESCDADQRGSRAEPEQKCPDHATNEHPEDGRAPTRPRKGRRPGRPRAERQNIRERFGQTYLHHRGRHVRDTRLDHRSAAPPHGASEQHDDDSHGVRRKALRSADGGGVDPGATYHSDLAGERDHKPAPPAPTAPGRARVGGAAARARRVLGRNPGFRQQARRGGAEPVRGTAR